MVEEGVAILCLILLDASLVASLVVYVAIPVLWQHGPTRVLALEASAFARIRRKGC